MALSDAIRAFFSRYPDVLYGFADIAYSPFAREYPSAVVVAVPYGRQLTLSDYTEPNFEAGIQSARARLGDILPGLEALLAEHHTACFIPPVAQQSEADLLAPFSFKYAATRAGLGWYGKNDVLITGRYGPRVRLSAVLVAAPLDYGLPIDESRCPDGCAKCVEACPCGAIRGVKWHVSLRREALVDYHRCNRMRSAFIPRLGRKSACGLCLAACPLGGGGEERPGPYLSTQDDK